jgi:O-antigen chain-terminating methyltransferase
VSSQRDYYSFMGYDGNLLKERYAPYAERFGAGARVVDIGCGRGEFLELLRDRGVDAIGVDADADMVAAVRVAGMEAEVANGREFLEAHPDEFDGVFAAHLIEHLQPADVIAFVAGAAKALRPGGRIVLVTPNPRNLRMHLRDFWIDLQHTRFYTPEIVRWILHSEGFGDLEDGENELYRSALELPDPAPPHIDNEPESPFPEHAPLGRAAHARQRLAEYLEAASSSERIQHLENRLAQESARTTRLHEALMEVQEQVVTLTRWLEGLFPGAEFWVTGTR